MNDTLGLALAWLAGGGLGAFFFGGLWWTIRRVVSSRRPALWVFGSLLLRFSVVLAGFYLVSDGRWEPILLCLLGFIMARVVVKRLTRTSEGNPTRRIQEVGHAPQS